MVCCIKGNGYENSVEKREFSKVVLVKGIYDDWAIKVHDMYEWNK